MEWNTSYGSSFVGLGFGGRGVPTTLHNDDYGSVAVEDVATPQHFPHHRSSPPVGYQMPADAAFVAAHVPDPYYPMPTVPHYGTPAVSDSSLLPPLTLNSQPPSSARPVFDTKAFHSSFLDYGAAALTRGGLPLPPEPIGVPMPDAPQGNIKDVAAEAELARNRALQIFQRFQQEADYNQQSEVAQKRKSSLEQLEQRKRVALIKNLEHLAKLEDERLQVKLQRVQDTQVYHAQMEAQHQQLLETRKQLKIGRVPTGVTGTINSQAGIGTNERQRSEHKRNKEQQQSISTDTVAIYVSNLPTDGSANEELLQVLFGSLGYSLRKIHFYYNKRTRELKGDALVIYQLPANQSRNTLTETVCSQMNGAELQCGTAIKVEPSDPLFKLKSKSEPPASHYGHASRTHNLNQPPMDTAKRGEDFDGVNGTKPEAAAQTEDDDNLVDFFESLE